MPRLSRAELEAYRGHTLPDLVGDRCRLLIVGINPGLMTVARQTHFCHPSNRFYPSLRGAGLIDWDLDSSRGLTDEQRADLLGVGIGITNLVARATARASELSRNELRVGARELEIRVADISPAVVAVLGVTAYRDAFLAPDAVVGPQPEGLALAEMWVVPNPSGLNAHVSREEMTAWMARLAATAGIEPPYLSQSDT